MLEFSQMGSHHVFTIPALFLLGMVAGYSLGGRAMRQALEKQQQRMKE